MQQVTLEKASQQLPSLVEAVLCGEEVIILMGG
jgi:antitoxin (DNA-binding transcriptional repressor) of toxin-antitoxin stability system